jgi:hypothetical protein
VRMLRTTLPIALALATMAIVAPTASAQTLELTDENTELDCPSVSKTGTDVNGGCLIHVKSEGDIELRKHVFGVESHLYKCTHEHALRIDKDGNGWLHEQVIVEPGGCPHIPCNAGGAENDPWAVHHFEGTPQGTTEGSEYLTINACFEAQQSESNETCEIDIPIQTYPNPHRSELGHSSGSDLPSHAITGFRCELAGHWTTETGGAHDGNNEQEVAVTHLQ